ncbi:MAG TPA: hypothetical protein VK217_12385 [Acidimicrobiales bacterium]|nr:hypothetical protein [Acidimicrobiales bacterium]
MPIEYQSQWTMMRTVAAMFRNDPYVVFEPYNEPNHITWAQWILIMKRTLDSWRGVLGYRGLLIIDTPQFSWGFEPAYVRRLQQYDAALLGRADLVIANHRYPDGSLCFCGTSEASWVTTVGQYSSRFPIVGTELGIYDGFGGVGLEWGRSFLAYLDSTAIPHGFNGSVIFVWSWVNADSIIERATGHFTAWGQVVANGFLVHNFATASGASVGGSASASVSTPAVERRLPQ